MTLIDTRTARSTSTAVYIAALVAAYLAAAALIKVIAATVFEIFATPDLYVIGLQWSDFATSIFRFVVVFALGVFLVLWLLAPITAAITLRLAIARAALAVGGGALLVAFVGVMLAGIGTVTSGFFGGYFPEVEGLGHAIAFALQAFFSTAVDLGPVVLLATVLVWLRLRSRATAAPTQ